MICRVNEKIAQLLLRLGRLCGGNGDVLGQVVGIPRLGRAGLFWPLYHAASSSLATRGAAVISRFLIASGCGVVGGL